ncbi:hypothetical protein HPP92_017226 [Vanilla planifolia]|uniref:Uncharacterized protein n=1 Tax=Vanilla planifolia TaxID=51239 RepID=A0A835QCD3_VANPL|nr:hypothetical protein HPP92_017226 [Vanilla planifolia]
MSHKAYNVVEIGISDAIKHSKSVSSPEADKSLCQVSYLVWQPYHKYHNTASASKTNGKRRVALPASG